jgi:hypothetical protein
MSTSKVSYIINANKSTKYGSFELGRTYVKYQLHLTVHLREIT